MKLCTTLLLIPAFSISFAQSEPADTITMPGTDNLKSEIKAVNYKNRVKLITGIHVAGYGTSLILLNNAWYKNYPRSSFHTFNDSKEWLQMDKVGHGWTAYTTGRASAAMWRWAGLPQKKAAWFGGLGGSAYLTVIEILDAHSADWGWSWADMAANILGSGLFIAQETGWQEQKIQFKFSFHKKNYDEPMLEQRAGELFGNSWYERMLKDYNAQTYWLSANLKSFFPDSKLPAWLNVAFGYSADGMFGGFENTAKDKDGNIIFDRRDIPRVRQYYIAPDIDLSRIKTHSKFLNTLLTGLNAFKFPAPAVMIDSKGKWKGYFLYF
jgi:hypothetical protein